MITYSIKSALCLALLLLFYHLVLEREKMHHFNRFYLLGSILFSFLAPFYKIQIAAPKNVFNVAITTQETEILATNLAVTETNYSDYLIVLYLLITVILLIRFIKNLVTITSKINKHQKIKKDKATLVLIDDEINPHTFWNYIFINKKEYFNNKIEHQLYTHELTHALQKHTFDVLLIEFLQAIFWINPTFIFLKKAMKLNHEFLADNNVITTYKNTTEYQYLLLNRAAWNNEYYLASNLNYLLTKKRLLMMTKQSSQTKILLKKLAVIPLCIGFTFLFAQRITAQEHANNKTVVEYNKLAKKYNSKTNNGIIKQKDVERLEFLYSKLSNEQKNKAETFPSIPPPPPESKTGFYEKDGAKLFYVKKDVKSGFYNENGTSLLYKKNKEEVTYYNSIGQKVTKEGKIIDEKRTNSDEVLPNQNITKVYKDGKVVTTFNQKGKNSFPEIKKGDITNIPPPPPTVNPPPAPPKITVRNKNDSSVEKMIGKTKLKDINAKYYLDNKPITKQQMEDLDVNNIATMNIVKKDGNNAIYITSKK